MAAREPKLAGRHKLKTLRLLAEGISHKQVALEMDCDPSAVTYFAARYKDDIEAKRANLDDEWAGLWIADKRQRVAVLAQIAEDMESELSTENYEGSTTEGRRVVMAALKQAAEELGQLVGKADLTHKQEVKYRLQVDGASEGDLT